MNSTGDQVKVLPSSGSGWLKERGNSSLKTLLDERMTTALYWLYDETRTHKSKKKQDVF